MNKKYTQCQSCGMPLQTKQTDQLGTEANGEKSNMYCELCYQNGEFTQPELTLVEMKITVDSALKEKGWIAPLRWMAKWQLPSLMRWKSQI